MVSKQVICALAGAHPKPLRRRSSHCDAGKDLPRKIPDRSDVATKTSRSIVSMCLSLHSLHGDAPCRKHNLCAILVSLGQWTQRAPRPTAKNPHLQHLAGNLSGKIRGALPPILQTQMPLSLAGVNGQDRCSTRNKLCTLMSLKDESSHF